MHVAFKATYNDGNEHDEILGFKGKRDMFATKPFSRLSKLLDEQKTLLGDLKQTERFILFATASLLGATVILAFETIAPFWLATKDVPIYVLIVLAAVVAVIIIMFILLNRKRGRSK